MSVLRRGFLVHGVFWRQGVRWAILNMPIWTEPIMMAFWSFLFVVWGPGRRGVMRNLQAIKPGSTAAVNFLRAWRVFYNFAWTFADTMRFRESRVIPDWQFTGIEHFEQMSTGEGGAIILTAHMGSYDLGAHLFSETSGREIVMIRAPEVDPDTHRFEELQHERAATPLRIDFNTNSTGLALDLLHAVREGRLVAIQGDRVTPGIASVDTTLFGRPARIPAGPFALAMAARVPIFPLFIIRVGRRRYELKAFAPIIVQRQSRSRDEDLQLAVTTWVAQLEEVIRGEWHQWFAFESFEREGQAA